MRTSRALIIGTIFSMTISCSEPTASNNELNTTVVDRTTEESAENALHVTAPIEPDSIQRITTNQIINPKFPLEDVFGIWTIDPDGPHADFRIDSNAFYIVDYDGNGNMPYTLKEDSLIIFFTDFTSKNKIRKADKDSLILENEDGVNKNVRWRN